MKQKILDKIIRVLEDELVRQSAANAQSNAGAVFSAPNAEKQRDTTGIEAAYLARGYAKNAQMLARQLDEIKAMEIEDFTGQEIDIGAIAEVEMGSDVDCYILLNGGGGTEVNVDGKTVTVITPGSPLGEVLMGNVETGFVELPSGVEGIILNVF